MFIQTESTPNPNTLKFQPGVVLLPLGETRSYPTLESCVDSSFARRLWEVEDVEGVFFGHDFITITKSPEADWYILKPIVLGIMVEHFLSNLPVVDKARPKQKAAEGDEDPLVVQIKEIIETRVRPAVAQDGGDIQFQSFEDGVVYLTMHGACSGCPSSTATLKAGIENMLRYYVPEVQEVKAV